MNPKLKAALTITAIIVIALTSLAVASALLTSNPVDVTPQLTTAPTTEPTTTPEPTETTEPVTYTLTLEANTTAPFLGETVKLTATINPAVQGVPISFLKNGTLIEGSQTVTNSQGIAEYITDPLTGPATKTYTAQCNTPE